MLAIVMSLRPCDDEEEGDAEADDEREGAGALLASAGRLLTWKEGVLPRDCLCLAEGVDDERMSEAERSGDGDEPIDDAAEGEEEEEEVVVLVGSGRMGIDWGGEWAGE